MKRPRQHPLKKVLDIVDAEVDGLAAEAGALDSEGVMKLRALASILLEFQNLRLKAKRLDMEFLRGLPNEQLQQLSAAKGDNDE